MALPSAGIIIVQCFYRDVKSKYAEALVNYLMKLA